MAAKLSERNKKKKKISDKMEHNAGSFTQKTLASVKMSFIEAPVAQKMESRLCGNAKQTIKKIATSV